MTICFAVILHIIRVIWNIKMYIWVVKVFQICSVPTRVNASHYGTSIEEYEYSACNAQDKYNV